MSEKTCGNCKNLIISGRKGAAFAGCENTGLVVPHGWDGETNLFTFWRIPTDCPRGDVIKSEKQAPRDEWVVKSFDDLKV